MPTLHVTWVIAPTPIVTMELYPNLWVSVLFLTQCSWAFPVGFAGQQALQAGGRDVLKITLSHSFDCRNLQGVARAATRFPWYPGILLAMSSHPARGLNPVDTWALSSLSVPAASPWAAELFF